jgi:hypothetical protein
MTEPNIQEPEPKIADIGNDNRVYIKSVSLTKSNWKLIEKPLTESDMKRNKVVSDLGDTTSTSNTKETTILNISNLITVGEYNYLKIRESVKNYISLPSIEGITATTSTKSTKDKGAKPVTKKVQMILDNCHNTIKSKIEQLVNILKEDIHDKMYDDIMINFNLIEIRVLILMKLLEYYTSSNFEGDLVSEREEILLASKKILYNLKRNKNSDKESNFFKVICTVVEISLPEQLIKDLEYKISELSKVFNVKLSDIANKRPKLIFDTKYDITIPEMKLKPFDSQVELINAVKNNIDNGFLLLYKTLPGLGKTTMILSICKFIKKVGNNKKVIFCCSDILESVRVQVLRIMYNFGIKFGIGIGNSENSYKITNSWNCKNDNERELIVCDYLSTLLILKENKNEYVLFFDEPTIMTDSIKNSDILELLARILYYLPKFTILSSATLPQQDEMQDIITFHRNKYLQCNVSEIVSNKTLVGCIIKDFSGKILTPHSYCKNKNDLQVLLSQIKKVPLLGKFYTLPYLINLNEFLKKYNKNIDLDAIECFDQESVFECTLQLLTNIASSDNDDIFNNFMNIKAVDIIEDSLDKERLDKDYGKIVFTKLITTHAFKYIGCCLVATQNPLEFVKTNFYPIVQKLKEKFNIKNINSVYEKYKKDTKNIKEMIDNIRLKYTSESVQEEKINELLRNKPCINFPNSIQVNSTDHIKGFAKYVKSYDQSLTKNSIMPESIDITNFNIDDDLKFLMYMGVGIYSRNLDRDYCNQVLELLSDRQLAFIISDDSFCYGANYQISNVIINDDLCDNHSINTILQLIGRTSRIGKSWAGKVYLDNNTCTRILKFFETPNSNIIECTNIVTSFNNIVPIIKNEELQKKLKEETKIASEINRTKNNALSNSECIETQKQSLFTINRPDIHTKSYISNNNSYKPPNSDNAYKQESPFTINRPNKDSIINDGAYKSPSSFTINRTDWSNNNSYKPESPFTINRPNKDSVINDNDAAYKPPSPFTINRPDRSNNNSYKVPNSNSDNAYKQESPFTINRPDRSNNNSYKPPSSFAINRTNKDSVINDNDNAYKQESPFTINRPNKDSIINDNDGAYKSPSSFTINRPDRSNNSSYKPQSPFTINRTNKDSAINDNDNDSLYKPSNSFTINKTNSYRIDTSKTSTFDNTVHNSNIEDKNKTINNWKNLRNKKN